jgi:hypothetical protein
MLICLSIIYKNTKLLEVLVYLRINQSVVNIDSEWLSLIMQAKEQGIGLKDIRIILAQQLSEPTIKEEV